MYSYIKKREEARIVTIFIFSTFRYYNCLKFNFFLFAIWKYCLLKTAVDCYLQRRNDTKEADMQL